MKYKIVIDDKIEYVTADCLNEAMGILLLYVYQDRNGFWGEVLGPKMCLVAKFKYWDYWYILPTVEANDRPLTHHAEDQG